ncbi:PAS domain S-box protein [Actinophytocola xanthii]|nr:PAS domain S-box protein [Actinophytocola xanthii]
MSDNDLLDILHDAVLKRDADGRLTYVNQGAVELYRRRPEELLGQVVHDVLGTTFPVSREEVQRQLETTGQWCGELVHHRPDGTPIVVSSRQVARREGGRVVSVVEINDDITERRIAENDLRVAEKQLWLILNGTEDYAINILAPDGRVMNWSASAERLTGYSEAEAIGRPYASLFAPVAAEDGGFDEVLAAAWCGPMQLAGEVRRKDGGCFSALGTVTPVHDADGGVSNFVTIIHDESERENAEAKFRGLLDSAPDAMIGVDPDGRMVFANLQAEALFGYSRAELIGQRMEMLLPLHIRKRHAHHRESFAAHPRTRPMGAGLELSARHREGTEFPVEVSLSTLVTKEGRIVSAAIRDITGRRRAHREIEALNTDLREANNELESRVDERTAALTAQAAVLKATNDELETFSYSVSHDLRAPLRAIDGFAKVLERTAVDALDEEGRRYLGKIRAGAKQMGQLIDGLLAFSNLQRQALVRTSVDLAALARTIWEELAPERDGREVDLTVADLPLAEADPRLLRHVFGNLLGNAIKYSRMRSPARVEVGATREHGVPVYFVRDNGVGFDMRYADKLFQVFQRMHRAEDFEGTGIGLALVARIVHRHGGKIWADAEPGRGATFFFTLGPDVPG